MNKSSLWVFSILKLPFTRKSSKSHSFTDEQVRAKAYELWLRRGAESSSEENWADAIKELDRKQRKNRILKPVRRLWWQTGLEESIQGVWIWTGIPEKKGWDFLQLLVAPLILAIIGLGLQDYIKEKENRQQKADKDTEQLLAEDKAKQNTLIKYLDQMAGSLKDGLLDVDTKPKQNPETFKEGVKKQKPKPKPETFIIAQARTVTTLQSLDGKRQHLVIQFLRSACLNQSSDKTDTDRLCSPHNGLLYKAQMEKANLEKSDLSGAVLKEAHINDANLKSANLRYTDFRGANLSYTDFRGADLSYANLSGANLSGANLSYAILTGANLSYAILKDTDFICTNLKETKLSNAILGTLKPNSADIKGTDKGTDFKYAQNLTTTQVKSANSGKYVNFNPDFRKNRNLSCRSRWSIFCIFRHSTSKCGA